MQKVIVTLPEIKLVGITTRTNNRLEMNPATAQIGKTVQKYFSEALPLKVIHRKKNGKTYSVYTEYENDVMGDYTYFIGEEVTSFDDVPEECVALTIPAQQYAKFTDGPGMMFEVCIKLWQKIWQMSPEQLGGERSYQADFEIYDERAVDPKNAVLDIYIGVK